MPGISSLKFAASCQSEDLHNQPEAKGWPRGGRNRTRPGPARSFPLGRELKFETTTTMTRKPQASSHEDDKESFRAGCQIVPFELSLKRPPETHSPTFLETISGTKMFRSR